MQNVSVAFIGFAVLAAKGDGQSTLVNSFKTVDRVYRDLPINRRTVNVVKKSWVLITGGNTETQ